MTDNETENDGGRKRATAAGHDFSGAVLMCRRCEVGLTPLMRQELNWGSMPACPNPRPDERRTGEERRGTSGNKYHRDIWPLGVYYEHPEAVESVKVDVYSVLLAFPTGHPGCDHAVKKILCAGIRGKGSRLQDLTEARDALDRAIQDAERQEPT